jgi:hypothetical protein
MGFAQAFLLEILHLDASVGEAVHEQKGVVGNRRGRTAVVSSLRKTLF